MARLVLAVFSADNQCSYCSFIHWIHTHTPCLCPILRCFCSSARTVCRCWWCSRSWSHRAWLAVRQRRAAAVCCRRVRPDTPGTQRSSAVISITQRPGRDPPETPVHSPASACSEWFSGSRCRPPSPWRRPGYLWGPWRSDRRRTGPRCSRRGTSRLRSWLPWCFPRCNLTDTNINTLSNSVTAMKHSSLWYRGSTIPSLIILLLLPLIGFLMQ